MFRRAFEFRVLLLLIGGTAVAADVSHILTPGFDFFHHHLPVVYPLQIALQAPQPPSGVYGSPPVHQPGDQELDEEFAGYPAPADDSTPPTPAPVQPTTTTTTEFTLPEIIENRQAKVHGNFFPLLSQYLPPPPDDRPNYESPKPPHQGEFGLGGPYYYAKPPTTKTTTTTSPRPIVVDNHYQHQIGYDYNAPPPSRPPTPAPVYLPPSPQSANGSIIQSPLPLRLRIKEMLCLHHNHRNGGGGGGGGGYFRAAMKVDNFLPAMPVLDNDSTDRRCKVKTAHGHVVVDIFEDDFAACGVLSCGNDLCLRLRFPIVRGMRTGSDAILTLHCRAQDRTAAKTHALKMAVANEVQTRSIGTYAHGGKQNPFRTHVELLRKSPQGIATHLEPNGVVQLGDEIVIRAHVLPGDGWNFTKLTDVNLQRISPSGETLNTANLVTAFGCLNLSMQGVYSQPPTFDPPLGHKLAFKAVMFEGMHSGDELVVSMRITGCLERHDCRINAQECHSPGSSFHRRRRRDTKAKDHDEMYEISRISFRVASEEYDTDDGIKNPAGWESQGKGRNRLMMLTISCGFVGLLICLGIFIAIKVKKNDRGMF